MHHYGFNVNFSNNAGHCFCVYLPHLLWVWPENVFIPMYLVLTVFICAGYAIVKMSSSSTLYFLVLRRHHLKRKKSFWWSSFTIFFMSHMSCAISRIFSYPSPRKIFSSILFQIWVKVFVYYWWSCIIILTSFVENINLVLLYFCHKAIDYTHTCVYIWICYSVSLVHLLSLFQHPHYLHKCSFNKSSSYKVLFI